MASGLHGKQQVLVLTRLALDAAWLAAQAPRYRFMAWSEADDGARAGARAVLTNGSTGLSAASAPMSSAI